MSRRNFLTGRLAGPLWSKGAIRVPLVAGGAGVPVIDRDRCSGACVSSCPADAVALRSRSAPDAA